MCIGKSRFRRPKRVACLLIPLIGLILNGAAGAEDIGRGYIGFSALTGSHWQICTLEPDSGNFQQITDGPVDKRETEWFDGGKRLIYRTANARFFMLNLSNEVETSLLETYGKLFDPDMSGNDGSLVFSRFRDDVVDDSDIWRLDWGDHRLQRLINAPGLQYDPAWSPDGSRVVYSSSDGSGVHDLWIMDRSGGESIRLTETKAHNIAPSWSPDGETIAFASNRTGDFEIWTIRPSGEDSAQRTRQDGLDTQPCWSPDGGKIAFISNRAGNPGIWWMNADGSDPFLLTPEAMRCADPVWLEAAPEDKSSD